VEMLGGRAETTHGVVVEPSSRRHHGDHTLGPMAAINVARARVGIGWAFAIHAVVMGSLGPRLPSIKDRTRVDEGELGLALSGFAVGLFLGTRLAELVIRRIGARALIRAGMPVLAATLIGPGLAWNLWSLAVSLFVLGTASGVLDVAINTNAVGVERGIGRPIMSGIHGLWSAGLLLGSAIAAGAAAIGMAPPEHFAIVACVFGLAAVGTLQWLMPDERGDGVELRGTCHPLRSRRVVLLGLIGFSCFLIEGSAMDWSALYLRESLGTSTFTAAFAVVSFSVGMMGSRFAGDRLSARLGAVRLVRAGGSGAAVTLAIGLIIHEPAVAIASFVLLGASVAPVVPSTFSAAGNTFVGSGTALGWVVTISYLGSMLGPAAIGVTADLVGLRLALVIPAVFALIVAAAASSVGSTAASGNRVV
jgi:MFS family permease